MKITFKNFRKYKKQTFIIQDDTFVLICGESGSGKSTILEGILFVLYDHIKKPYTFDKTTCKVIFEHEDIIITRQKGPSKLTISYSNLTCQDLEAQAFIDSKYGTYELFIASTYLRHEEKSPLLSSSNRDKLELIQQIAFKDENIFLTRKKIISNLSSQEQLLKDISIKIQTKKAILNDFVLEIKDYVDDLLDETQITSIDLESLENKIQIYNNKILILEKALENSLKHETKLETSNKLYSDLFKEYFKVLSYFKRKFSNHKNQSELEVIHNSLHNFTIYIDDYLNDYKDIPISTLISSNISFVYIEENILHSFIEKCKSYVTELRPKLNNIVEIKKNYKLYIEYTKVKETMDSLSFKFFNLFERMKAKYNELTKEDKPFIKEIFSKNKWNIESNNINDINKDIVIKIVNTIQENLEKNKQIIKLYEKFNIKNTDNIDNNLSSFTTTLQDLEKDLISNERLLLNLQLEEEKNYSNSIYLCPNCDKELVFNNDKLELVKETSNNPLNFNKDNINDSDKTTKSILKNKILEEKSNYSKRITKIKTDILSNINNIEHINMFKKMIKDIKYTPIADIDLYESYNIMNKELIEIIEEYNNYKIKIDTSMSVIDIKQFENITSSTDKYNNLEEEEKRLKQIIKITEEIVTTVQTIGIKLVDIKVKIKAIEKERNILRGNKILSSKTIKEKIKKKKSKKQELEIFIDLYKFSTKFITINRKIAQYEIRYKQTYNKITTLQLLKEKCIEAECIALDNTIAIINYTIATYISELFTLPIEIILKTTKELKSKKNDVKNCFSMSILYQGVDYESDIGLLSSGERGRISFVLLWTLNEICGSPFIFIDEGMNTIGSDLKNEIIQLLRIYCKNKTIIMIDHNATKGLFDDIIEL